MSDYFLGEIRPCGFNFAPVGWALCNGQLLSISQNTALFSLIGTYYGGNGTTNFALPDLRGRVAIALGQGPGLSDYVIGEQDGVETVTLITSDVPAHNHLVNADNAPGNSTSPANSYTAESSRRDLDYGTTSNTTMNPNSIGPVGGSQPHDNMQPYLVLNYVIALTGIYPPRG